MSLRSDLTGLNVHKNAMTLLCLLWFFFFFLMMIFQKLNSHGVFLLLNILLDVLYPLVPLYIIVPC